MYADYDSYDMMAALIGTGVMTVYMIFVLVNLVLTIIARSKLYTKAGRPGWASLIPFYTQYCFYDIAWGTGWLFLLGFVPIVNIVVGIMVNFKLAKAFGKGTGFGFGLLFLNTIFMLILGLGDAKYEGPAN